MLSGHRIRISKSSEFKDEYLLASGSDGMIHTFSYGIPPEELELLHCKVFFKICLKSFRFLLEFSRLGKLKEVNYAGFVPFYLFQLFAD